MVSKHVLIFEVHSDLRAEWLAHGAQWFSEGRAAPVGWDAYAQLLRARLGSWHTAVGTTGVTTIALFHSYPSGYRIEPVAEHQGSTVRELELAPA